MARINSNYYMSCSDYLLDSHRFREVVRDSTSSRSIGYGVDGKTYYASDLSIISGRPEWLELACVSCGENHGVTTFDGDKCEVSIKRKNKTLHKLYFARL